MLFQIHHIALYPNFIMNWRFSLNISIGVNLDKKKKNRQLYNDVLIKALTVTILVVDSRYSAVR